MNKTTKTLIIIISALILLAVWFFLTRAAIIPNFLGWDFLCPNQIDSGPPYFPKNPTPGVYDKPVIYLYPQQTERVNVKLNIDGNLLTTYPKYQNGWSVLASPDGKLINLADGKEYSYLFWDGKNNYPQDYNLTEGFVVEGGKTVAFLQDKLSQLGLTPKEYNEFIVYWLPQMEKNKYNLIHFATKSEYADHARLEISPQPDSMLRVFMVFKPLDSKIDVKSQSIETFKRNGFAVVEWGGTEIK